MILHKLEIKGFKSFGDKVVFHFDKGVTGIVGPNGSGKSNVVDAIRWVLGEQSSRALRSDKMENVIFNGTKNRKPLQLAEVTLVFKNTKNLLPTEYAEILISRRYYRSGDSEYLLNGVTCRLKDIQSLFMDTGVSSDSYAIIELKMVDDILNDHDHSRRSLFEEAAGISKFKKRKKETLKKLEDTKADLERVEDLLAEISRNLKTLEKQAKQAQQYLQMKEEYKRLSILLATKMLGGQITKLQALSKRMEEENDRKAVQVNQYASVEAAVEKEKNDLLTHERLLASRQKTLNDHVHQIRQFESDKKIKNERLRYLNEKATSLQAQLSEDLKSNERSKFSLESLEKEQVQVDKMLRETTFLLDQAKQEYERQKQATEQVRLQAAELGTQLKSKQQALYQMRKTLEINEVQYSSLKMELEKESVESTEKTASLEEFEVRLQAVTLELSQKTEAYSAMLAKQQELEQQIMSGETAVKALEEQLSKSARVLDARQNEFNLTRSMLENLEGYPQAIRFIKKSTPWGKDAPLFSDIITCDEKYRVAIENFLEPWLNFFVLQNESQAFEAVNLLSDAAKGKGNFLLLDSFEQYQPQAFRQYEDALPALQVVEYDERYRYLVHAMLDGVYIVVKNQEQLPADDQVTFITQNGKVIRKKNTISGGSVGLFEGKKLGRIKNLEKLTVEIRELQQKNKQLEKVIQQKKSDLQYLKEELPGPQLQTLQQALARVQQDHVALKTRKEQFEEMLLAKENKQELMQEKIAQLAESITQLRPKVSEEVDALDELENRQADLADEAEQQSALLATRSAAFNQLNIQFHQQTNRLESIEKEMGYKESSYERVRARIENSQFELKNTETEILQLRESSGQHEQQLVDLYEEKERIESAVREAEKAYYQSRGQIGELEKQARELQKNREQVDQWLMECREQVNQIRMGMAATKERMLVEFETDLEALIAEDREDPFGFTEEYLREEVQKIKGKMEKMGAINHMAIEAYKEIEERHNFILAQRKDLLEAIASLHTTIGEIDTVAKENFLEAFTKIRENFIEVFRSLFTADDRCDLILLNPDDPLESKIEITAQPKGKRPLTINQLSGGEKTLTATALLFAIYLLKPAPFCIFDEVDAPLDDANIDKFNQIIKKFSANSQFIIVTHNKRTMASTDVMYGITMIEQGVSTVVPVDLREMQ